MLFVRPINSDDWPAYREIRLKALKESPDAFGSTSEQETMLPEEEWITRAIASESGQSGRGFFAVNNDEVCGLVWCLLSDSDLRIAHIYSLWIAPSVRGRGAGRALLERCIAWAKDKRALHIHLSVTVDESPAMMLYRSRGFYPVGEPERLRPNSELEAQKMELSIFEGV